MFWQNALLGYHCRNKMGINNYPEVEIVNNKKFIDCTVVQLLFLFFGIADKSSVNIITVYFLDVR